MANIVVTIARSYGSGGKQIGKLLAKELGIPCYDREILRLASDMSGISENLFGEADETSKKNLLYTIARNVYKGELFGPDSDDFTSDENLFNYQAKVMKELASKESCVIVGRCADFVLKDHPGVIRVFAYCNKEQSLKNIKEVQGLEGKAAQDLMEKRDKYRASYYKYHTGREWNDAKNYDLCINTDHLTFAQCVQLVRSYIQIKGSEEEAAKGKQER